MVSQLAVSASQGLEPTSVLPHQASVGFGDLNSGPHLGGKGFNHQAISLAGFVVFLKLPFLSSILSGYSTHYCEYLLLGILMFIIVSGKKKKCELTH